MKPSQLRKELSIAFQNRLKYLIVGPPGTGKTEIVTDAAKASDCDLVLMHPSVSDPTDFKGLPGIVNDLAEFLPYGQLRKLIDASKPTIAFLDDIGQAPHAVQAALMQLLQSREIDGQRISDHVTFCGATNDSSHMAGVQSILEPVKSRWHTIVHIEVDHIEWVKWAKRKNLPEPIISWVMFKGMEALHDFTPTRELKNSPSPRTIFNASQLFSAGLYSRETLAGAAGEGWASAFLGFLRVYRSLPDPDECIANPDKAPLPSSDDASTIYAIAVAVSLRANKHNFDGVTRYLKRLPKETEVFAIRDTLARESKLQNTAAFTAWACDNIKVLS